MYQAVKSPPLQHPIPQHPIPQFPTDGYGQSQANPGLGLGQMGQPQTQMPSFGLPFDPTAQIGIQVANNALNYGQEYLGKNIDQYVSSQALRYYFQVSNGYVLRKLALVLFPWRHKPWTRQLLRSEAGDVGGYATARDDVNAPDMYIPVMAFTTYILLSSVFAGIHGTFHPQILGLVASKAVAYMLVEIMVLKLGTYLLGVGSKLTDLIAYSGYKFIGVVLSMTAGFVLNSPLVKWLVFTYTALSTSFFMLRSLRYVLLPDSGSISSAQTINAGQRQRRIQFLFVYAFVIQLGLMWLLV